MRHPAWYIVIALAIAFCISVSPSNAQGEDVWRLEASRLTAQAKLARFAAYYGASAQVRQLGQRMAAVIERCAADRGIHLPNALNDHDRRLVQRLEGLQGDDFDLAYLDTILEGSIGQGVTSGCQLCGPR